MRLTPRDIDAVGRAAGKAFSMPVEIRLFGSRADDRLKGGDIDLLVIGSQEPRPEALRRFIIALEEELGEQKIDVIGRSAGAGDEFFKSAMKQSVKIWGTEP